MKEFTVESPSNLKTFTDNTYPQGSFYFNALLKKKDIRVNGVKVDKNVSLQKGDTVAYYTTPLQEAKPAFYPVFEDENILVVDKESGVNAEALFFTLSTNKECYFIHRLDRNTQGLMIFAKNKISEAELLQAFKDRSIDKIYHAVCIGQFKKEKGILEAYLKKDAHSSTVQVSQNPKDGIKIITEYRLLKREKGLNYLEVILHTGKTHQIRAHLAHVGCPILGDTKYGDATANRQYNRTRQCLVAKRLVLHTSGVLAYLNGREFLSNFNCKAGE